MLDKSTKENYLPTTEDLSAVFPPPAGFPSQTDKRMCELLKHCTCTANMSIWLCAFNGQKGVCICISMIDTQRIGLNSSRENCHHSTQAVLNNPSNLVTNLYFTSYLFMIRVALEGPGTEVQELAATATSQLNSSG